MPRKSEKTETVTRFTKDQLLKSKQFNIQEKDIIQAIVKDEKLTVKETKDKIKNFLKRKVK